LMNLDEEKIAQSFSERWGYSHTVMSKAPGRVNIIGEHTDYTGGYVLPAAINRDIIFAAAVTKGSDVRGYSLNYCQNASCRIGNYDPLHPVTWFRYVMGIMNELEKTGYSIQPFDFCVGGNIPIGSGLSSSAALGMAVLVAMEQSGNFKMDDNEAALLCQRAENNFVGVKCGIMDMLISRKGRRDHALFVNCTDLSSRMVSTEMPGYLWLVIDSGKRRGLMDSEYNKRRSECEEALKIARLVFPHRNLFNLRDISRKDLPHLKTMLDEVVYRRLSHVVTENERVLQMVGALEAKDSLTAGRLLISSYESLKSNFEVSCKELDSLVKIVCGVKGVYGARPTGAGFGGSIIVLAQTTAVTAIENAVNEKYNSPGLFDTEAKIMPVRFSDGAHVI